jgi:HemY protein
MRAILILVLVAIVVALGVLIADQSGQVAIGWQDWRIETSLPVLLVGVLVIAAVVTMVFVTVRSVLRAPDSIIRSSRDRRRRAGYRALTRGWSRSRPATATRPSARRARPTCCLPSRR